MAAYRARTWGLSPGLSSIVNGSRRAFFSSAFTTHS